MNKTNNSNSAIDFIKNYLDGRAVHDRQFAQNYKKEHKSLKECYAYILGEARKRAVNNACCMTSEEVFGLAVHYYDEDDIVVKTSTGKANAKVAGDALFCKKKDKPSDKKALGKSAKVPKTKKEHKKPARKKLIPVQLELFEWND